jgi:hypothetical protein
MSPTRPSLWAFRTTVALGLAGIVYSSRTGTRYLLWATLVVLLLAIFTIQSFGQVVRREGATAPDRLTQAMNGPNGLRVRAGLLFLALLLVLLGVGALEPANLVEWFFKAKNAA